MVRYFINIICVNMFVILTLTQQCWSERNHDDYKNVGSNNPHQPNYQSSNRYEINGDEVSYPDDKKLTMNTVTTQPISEEFHTSSHDRNVKVIPQLGLIRGHNNFKIIKNRQISAYLGLKYGSVKPGLGRFQKASSVDLNENVIDATKEPPNCPQFPDLETIKERENRLENVDDCLTLNIFNPAEKGSYPVVVFVHGEMLFDGSAAEGQSDYFLENDVVLVTINYRLAPFGYLSTLTDEMPGNLALSDIQMALEWIKKYIRSFNGNPDQVTLMGQSGGATLIHALSLSSKAENLFHRLILQSGTALNPYFLDEQPLDTLRSFAHYARCPYSENTDSVPSCFERMTTSDLLYYFKGYFENNEHRGLQFVNGFKLIVGDKLGYLPQHPASFVGNNTKPLIVGVTKDAGAFLMTRFYDQLVQLRSRNISDYINVILKHTTKPKHYTLWKQWALKHIFNADDIRNPSVSTLVQKLLELINLILYRGPIIDSIRNTYKNHSTYMYSFDYRGEYRRFGHLQNPLPFEIDATLSDENIFLFPYPEEVSRLNAKDKSVSRDMVTMWVNFAMNNVPNPTTSIWPNVSSEYGPFIRFTNIKKNNLELDFDFCEGIPVPNLYSEYFNTTKTKDISTKNTTAITTSTTPWTSLNLEHHRQPPLYSKYQRHNIYRLPKPDPHKFNEGAAQ